jgi:hypothetical protein
MPTSPAPIAHKANGSISTATPANLVAFAHAALFSPSLTTLGLALAKGYIPNLPGLSTATLRRHPPNSAAMVKGHLVRSLARISAEPGPRSFLLKQSPSSTMMTTCFPLPPLTVPDPTSAILVSWNPPAKSSPTKRDNSLRRPATKTTISSFYTITTVTTS